MSIPPTMSTPFFFKSILAIPEPIAPSPQIITFTFFMIFLHAFFESYKNKLI